MESVSFPSAAHILKPQETVNRTYTPYEAQQNFSAILKESIEKVNEAQQKSDILTEKLAKGENVDLHQVMIESQKASVSLQLTMEIRNKAIEAYQEIMRMQV
ncbi:flagellar hook-basal body complex protein FliE [Bacillus canaveralius]|uniref:Flagellar hook-basal body complex protein FliE n=1 Tax=Bacillus canaveralius TaxID=1403243 RepID=A0A2N5GNY2_9BACI|nr:MULTISPECIES: flagellar hook-basal body complex protein FliE [Bacillus]PLR84208.1 flagellar hook-basal body complex protein FliE [Bacillus canaveralius]PLR87473.1 flagellar hook-basal body complex protein FliE [Bacillus sp. V33-4]PLR96146.1 flagellar hook-basal body complex protein FliE [Bacillus canaveralius]RSK45136.1 flagellar hook-basal body complex protein FliE [Bacillus canaveralius]